VTESSSKDPTKRAVPKSGDARSPLEDLVPEGGAAGEDADQPPIVLDMDDDPFVLEVVEPAATTPEPERPRGHEAASPPPAAEPRPPAADEAPIRLAPLKPAVEKPPAEARKVRPDYTSDLPSIVTEGVRERFSPPPPAPSLEKLARKQKPAARAGPAVPRLALVALAGVALAGGGLWLFLRMRPAAPVIMSVMPPKAEPGQTITLTGTGFDPDAAGDTVRFGDQTGQVTSASETQLAVTVPAALSVTDVTVRVETRGGKSNALFVKVYRGPRVTSVDPPVALPGSEVVLRGDNLGGSQVKVMVGGLAATVKDSSPTAVRILVPDLPVLEGRPVPVSVQAGGESGRPAELILGRLPLVTSVTPRSGPPGTPVTVRGHGFDPDARGNRMTIGGEPALLLSATANEIAAIVPPSGTGASQTEAPVVVQARGGTSSAQASFVLASPSEAFFRPYYFPAAAADRPSEDVVLVSTELGPALLLGGKADAPSTAERAARAAAALNAVVQAAAAKPAVLEVRDRPATGVAVAGGPGLLVAATTEDAAAYAREPSARGQRASPRALAEYWAALLQDHLTLFVQKQRPLRLVELSPRGRVLLDLFSEGQRRAGVGAGVPIRLVRPLPAGMARSFRELALILPSGPATAAAAVAGRWEGTMQEGGDPARRVTVELRLDGNRLSGSLTTRSRAVAMGVPLKDLRYEKGRLSFVLSSGGASHHWTGDVQGAAVEGSIRDGAREVGRFSLRFTE
jgi:hypothetical protein